MADNENPPCVQSAASGLGDAMQDLIDALRSKEAINYGLEHAEANSEYDDIVALASAICGTPIAVITLIDHRTLWFKASCGADFPPTMEREDAVCNITIANPNDMTIVYDADTDARCGDLPYFNGIKADMKFYAGLPLITPTGYAIGTICVVDKVPRSLSPYQMKLMEKLRRLTVGLLVSRRQLAAAQATKP